MDRQELPVPPPLDSSALTPVAAVGPEIEDGYSIRTPHRGDTPMMRTWKMLGWQSLLAAALASAPAPAQDKGAPKEPSSEPSATKTDDKEELLKEIRNKFKALGQQIEEFDKSLKSKIESLAEAIDEKNKNTELRIQNMLGDIQKLQADLGTARNDLSQVRQDLKDILSKELAALRQDTEGLRKRFYEPGPAPTAQAPAGRVQFINAYPDMMTVILNGRAYQLLPNETRLVSVPAGPFTYQVMRVHTDLQPRTLTANQTYTITVHPQ
jgi:hypothetical protein